MSDYIKEIKTDLGTIQIQCIDNCFGQHNYGYILGDDIFKEAPVFFSIKALIKHYGFTEIKDPQWAHNGMFIGKPHKDITLTTFKFAFKTNEEAHAFGVKLNAIQNIWKFKMMHDGEYKPNWENVEERKYFPVRKYFGKNNHKLEITFTGTVMTDNFLPVFSTEALAMLALQECKQEYSSLFNYN